VQECWLAYTHVRSSAYVVFKPFNDSAGLYLGRHIFVNNSAASIARELFKPSTDSASRLVSIINFMIWLESGVFCWWRHKEDIFSNFSPILTCPGYQSNEPFCWLKHFLETIQSAAFIEPLLDLLACLEPKLWPKKTFYPNIRKLQKNALSLPLAAFRLAITWRWNMIVSYSNPRKTRKVL